MFDEKEKIKFLAEGIRNGAITLIAGGMISLAVNFNFLGGITLVHLDL